MQTDTTIIDVAPGLWVWRTLHTEWRAPEGVDKVVTSTCVAFGGEVAVIDALAPPEVHHRAGFEQARARPPFGGRF